MRGEYYLSVEVVQVRDVVVNSVKVQQRSRLAGHGRHLYSSLDVNL